MTDDYFSATYSDARANFLSACIDAGVPVTSYRNPEIGPNGEKLYCDATWLGNRDATGVVVVTSSTHGVEGFAGSAIQIGLLRDAEAPKPGPGTALLLVHTINPYGMAWLQRENEDHVDLNRNFVDHEGGDYPENELFEELVDHIVPKTWDDETLARNQQAIKALGAKHGDVAVRKSMHKGQYRHPDSIHYGGNKPTWSNLTLGRICAEYLDAAASGAMIDIHTGLGPYGYGELMTPSKPGERVFDRFFDWYGEEVHSTTAGTSDYAGSKGSILAGFRPSLDDLDWAAIGLEYGTRERDRMRRAMMANAWLNAHGEYDSNIGREIKREALDCSYPRESEWMQMVWERGREVIGIALERVGGT